MEMQSSRCPPPHPREVPTMKISARTAAHARWTAQDLIDATSLRLSTLRTFATTPGAHGCNDIRSEEHTSELQSLMRNSYAVSCLTKTNLSTPNDDKTKHKHK